MRKRKVSEGFRKTFRKDETPVAEDNSQEVCPQETQTYTLSVTYPNGEDVERQITISVPE